MTSEPGTPSVRSLGLGSDRRLIHTPVEQDGASAPDIGGRSRGCRHGNGEAGTAHPSDHKQIGPGATAKRQPGPIREQE